MAKIPFTVSARTAKLIGQENFATADGAIVELVKNTYDADGKNCIVIFENHDEYSDNPSIYIIDNGTGMTDKVIEKHWMTIGTDDKLQNHQSNKGRVKTGAKGIGRFALNRLGVITELFTVSQETSKGYIWEVNWEDFDKTGAIISEVEANLVEEPDLNLTTEITNQFSQISGINELLKENKFETGTIIKISNLNDEWDDEAIKKLFSNLEILIPPKEQSDFDIHLFSTIQPEDFGKVNSAYYDDYDYKVIASYLDDSDKSLIVEIHRNELDIDILENKYKEVFDFDTMKSSPYRLKDIKLKSFKIKTSIHDLKGFSKNVKNELINNIGKFGFTFYYLKNTISDNKSEGDIKRYPYKGFISANRKAWLKKFGGVKIFRDDFRVRPYGAHGDDWLKLGERQAQSPGGAGQKLGGFRIRPNQISGTINISRIYNSSFQDKSGREGIQENDTFELFKNLLLEIISFFEKDRNTIMYYFSELAKKRNQAEEDKRKAKEAAERVRKDKEAEEQKEEERNTDEETKKENTSSESNVSQDEESLAKGYSILEQELEEKNEEIRLLRNLASVGLIISSFAHEVKSLRSRLVPRTDFLIRELKKHISESTLKKLNPNDNPFYMLRLIQEEDVKLKHWLDYSLSSLKRDKRERKPLNFGVYFEKFKQTWNKAVGQRNVSIKLNGDKNSFNNIRAFEVDMDSIFNNLLSNSLNSLKQKNSDKKSIEINWCRKGDFIEILFSDNGIGLVKEYKELPDEIFNVNETSKRDKRGKIIGTGLGLYIVKSVVEEYNNSTITIENFNDGFSVKLLFPIRK